MSHPNSKDPVTADAQFAFEAAQAQKVLDDRRKADDKIRAEADRLSAKRRKAAGR